MADHLYQQPVTIDLLVGYAVEGLALTQLDRFVIEDKPAADQLKLIRNSVKGPEDNWGSDFIKILQYEGLLLKNTFCKMAYEVNPEGKVRLSRDPLALFRDADSQELPTLTYLQRKLNKARTILERLHYPSSPEKMAKIFDASFEKYYAMAEPDFDWSKEPAESRPSWKVNYRSMVESLTGILGPSYHRIHEIHLRNLCSRRGSRILIAIKQYHNEHGTWPENLEQIKGSVPAEALVDPITGDAFVYKLTGADFMLYSRGKNGIDECGMRKKVVDPNAAGEPVDPNFFKDMLELYREEGDANFYEEIADDPNILKEMYDPNDYRPTITIGDDWRIWPPRGRKTNEEDTYAEKL